MTDKRLHLDEVLSLDEAAKYLEVSRWWLQRRLSLYIAGNNAPAPVAKIGHLELWTKEQLDTLTDLPKAVWPEYSGPSQSMGWEWQQDSDFYYTWWKPISSMVASNPDEARKNADAWLFVADNWSRLTFQDEPSS